MNTYQNGLDDMEKETYNNNFLSKETNTLEEILTSIAKKIYLRMKEENREFLWTDRTSKTAKEVTYDSLYGYIYDNSTCDIYERNVKGFAIIEGALFICMDLSNIYYPEIILKETFDEDDCWHPLYDSETDKLYHNDDMNTFLTLLSISECIYQYFD